MINLIEKLDSFLEKQNVERTLCSHHPSAITNCIRQTYYKWKKAVKSNPIDGSDLFKMQIGHLIHDLLHKTLKDSGLDIISETEFKEIVNSSFYPLSGRVDNLFIEPETKQLSGIEVKTSFGQGIKAMRTRGKPDPDHLWQVICYILFAKIESFYLLYIARDSGYKTQFHIHVVDGDIYCEKERLISMADARNLIARKITLIEDAITRDNPPPKPYQAYIGTTKRKDGTVEHGIKDGFSSGGVKYSGCWQCSYCSYANYCWAEELSKYHDTSNEEDVIAYYNKKGFEVSDKGVANLKEPFTEI